MKNSQVLLHVITSLSVGGAQRALYNLLHGGLAGRFDNTVLSLMDEGDVAPQIRGLGVPVYELGMRHSWPSPRAVRKLRKIVRKIQPDLIQGWMYHGNLVASLAQILAVGKPALAWNVRHSLHDINYEKRSTRMVIKANKWLSGKPDLLLYNSHVSKKQHESFGFASKNGHVILNGIDTERFSFSAQSRTQVRTECNIPENAIVVGHVARYHPMKDHVTFLRAMAELVREYPHVHALLCGRKVTIENEALMSEIPKEYRSRFHLLGQRNDIVAVMSAMDIFCSSSAWGEGFPNVLGEAMSVGVPCIATDVGDSKAVVGEVERVVAAGEPSLLYATISRHIRAVPDESEDMARLSRRRINNNFSIKSVVKKYASIYRLIHYKSGIKRFVK